MTSLGDAAVVGDVVADASLDALVASGPLEVLVGVYAVNQSARIEGMLDAMAGGLAGSAASRRTGVLVADAGSQDGTADIVRAWCASGTSAPLRGCLDVIAPRHRGRALTALLLAAQRLGASALLLVDADLDGVDEAWLRALLEPLLRGEADYVSPAYVRSVSEGTLTTNLLAPLTRALYGVPVQQVIGGCAGVTGKAIGSWLAPDVDTAPWPAHGAELWLTTAAVASGARVAEARLGKKAMASGGPPPDLSTILARSVGALFALMERHQTAWLDRREDARAAGPSDTRADAHTPAVAPMVRAFDLGLKDLLPVWEQIMPESTLAQLYPLALLDPDEFRLPPSLWARLVSDFAVAHHERRLPRDHLLRALTPLYLGRVAAFVVQTRALPPGRLPEIFETIDRAFEDERPHLVARWR